MRIIFILFIAFLVTGSLQAQEYTRLPVDSLTGKIIYQGVVTVDSALKNELYSRGKLWIAQTYKSAKEVIQLDDPVAGTLLLKSTFEVFYSISGTTYIHHQIQIDLKDGKYRYKVSDFIFDYTAPSLDLDYAMEDCYPPEKFKAINKKPMIRVYQQIDETVNALIASLESVMKAAGKTEDGN